MPNTRINVFIAPEMAALMPQLVGAELVVKSSKVAKPALKCMEQPEGKPFVGFYGNLYYYLPIGQNPFNRWYYNDGRMDEPCYLPVYQLARHPDDPDSPWITFLSQRPAALRIVLEGVASPLLGRPLIDIDCWVAKNGGPLAEYAKRPPRPLPHSVRSVTLSFPAPIGTLKASRIDREGSKLIANFDLATGVKDHLFRHLSGVGAFTGKVEVDYNAATWATLGGLGEEFLHHLVDFEHDVPSRRCRLLELWVRRLADSEYVWIPPAMRIRKRPGGRAEPARDEGGPVPVSRSLDPKLAQILKNLEPRFPVGSKVASLSPEEEFEYQFYEAKFDKPEAPSLLTPLADNFKTRTEKATFSHNAPLDPGVHPKLFPDYGGTRSPEHFYKAVALRVREKTQFVYQDPSNPRMFYYLPDAFNLALNRDGSPKGFLVDLIGGSQVDEPMVSVELTAAAAISADLLEEAARELSKQSLGSVELHCLNPASLEFSLNLPSDKSGSSSELRQLPAARVQLDSSVMVAFNCSLSVFTHNVFERLFDSGAHVLTGKVEVPVETCPRQTISIPVSFHFPEPRETVSPDQRRNDVWNQIRPSRNPTVFTRIIRFQALMDWFTKKHLKQIVVEVTGGGTSLVFTAETPVVQSVRVSTSIPLNEVPNPVEWFDFDYRTTWIYEGGEPISATGHGTGDCIVLQRVIPN